MATMAKPENKLYFAASSTWLKSLYDIFSRSDLPRPLTITWSAKNPRLNGGGFVRRRD